MHTQRFNRRYKKHGDSKKMRQKTKKVKIKKSKDILKPFKCKKSKQRKYYKFGLEEDVFEIDKKNVGGGVLSDSSMLLPKNNFMSPLPDQSSNIPIPPPFSGSSVYYPDNISTWPGVFTGGGDYYSLNKYSPNDISRQMSLGGGIRIRKIKRLKRPNRGGSMSLTGLNNMYNNVIGKSQIPSSNPVQNQLPNTYFGKL